MLRYLKYVFLVFALLALSVASFFFLNNKHDIMSAFDARDNLSYESIQKNCPEARGKYYYPCFKKELEAYMQTVSITGVSIGLKFAFNFIEEDKAQTTFFKSEKIRDLHYSINFLEINNMAINHSYKRYFGFEFAYPGFISKLEDHYKSAYEFSENIIHGLRGRDGIASVTDDEENKKLTERFEAAVEEFNQVKLSSSNFVNNEILKLTESENKE